MRHLDTRGLEGLPLKLLIVLLLVSLSSPLVFESLQYHERTVAIESLRTLSERIRSVVLSAFVSGPGNIRTIDVTIPSSIEGEQSWIEIGGSEDSVESLSIRCWIGEHKVIALYLEDPPVRMSSQSGDALTIRSPGSKLEVSCVQTERGLMVLVGVGHT